MTPIHKSTLVRSPTAKLTVLFRFGVCLALNSRWSVNSPRSLHERDRERDTMTAISKIIWLYRRNFIKCIFGSCFMMMSGWLARWGRNTFAVHSHQYGRPIFPILQISWTGAVGVWRMVCVCMHMEFMMKCHTHTPDTEHEAIKITCLDSERWRYSINIFMKQMDAAFSLMYVWLPPATLRILSADCRCRYMKRNSFDTKIIRPDHNAFHVVPMRIRTFGAIHKKKTQTNTYTRFRFASRRKSIIHYSKSCSMDFLVRTRPEFDRVRPRHTPWSMQIAHTQRFNAKYNIGADHNNNICEIVKCD